MDSKDYLKLCEEAQRKKLKLTKKQEQQIKQIYNEMHKHLSKKLDTVTPGTITEMYLKQLQKDLENEIRNIHIKVSKIIENNIKKSSNLANDVQLDFFMQINKKYELNLENAFLSMFSNVPKQAMDEILFGSVYKDGKGISERIWIYSKKFDKDIDYIIAQGIAEKKSAYDVAKDLEIYLNPSSRKDWSWKKVYPNASKTVDYNAQRLARTSINHAFQQAQKRSCKKNPYVTAIRWLSAEIHGRTCQQCMDRNNTLYKVEEVPLDHANGLCYTVPEIPMSLEDIGSELREWIDGASIPKLDKWFEKYGDEFI